MRALAPVVLVMAACVATPAARAPRVFGAMVRVEPDSGEAWKPVTGELLAVSSDSIWLLREHPADRDTVVAAFPRESVRVLAVPRRALHPFRWSLIGGALTGGGMTLACSQASDGCGAVFLSMFLTWQLVGGLAAAISSADRGAALDTAPATLRTFARFPAGLPPGFPRVSTPPAATGGPPGG